jgi:hypothetical protein
MKWLIWTSELNVKETYMFHSLPRALRNESASPSMKAYFHLLGSRVELWRCFPDMSYELFPAFTFPIEVVTDIAHGKLHARQIAVYIVSVNQFWVCRLVECSWLNAFLIATVFTGTYVCDVGLSGYLHLEDKYGDGLGLRRLGNLKKRAAIYFS